MAADQIEINIYLKGENGTDKSQDTVTGTGGNLAGLSQANGADKKAKALSALGKYVASQTISVFLNDTKNAVSQNIGLVTGKTELQQRVNFGMQVAQLGVNTYRSAQAGATLFAAAGLAPGIGQVVAVALSAIQFGINTAFKQQQLNIQENLENKQISQTLGRYGAGYNKSRSGL